MKGAWPQLYLVPALKVPCASHTLNWENICPIKPCQQILALCQGIFKPRDGSPAQCGFCFLSPSSDEPDASSARLLFCHCQQATDVAQPCRKTPMEQDLTVLNIHRHLKLMGAPLVVRWGERNDAPGSGCAVRGQLGQMWG